MNPIKLNFLKLGQSSLMTQIHGRMAHAQSNQNITKTWEYGSSCWVLIVSQYTTVLNGRAGRSNPFGWNVRFVSLMSGASA